MNNSQAKTSAIHVANTIPAKRSNLYMSEDGLVNEQFVGKNEVHSEIFGGEVAPKNLRRGTIDVLSS